MRAWIPACLCLLAPACVSTSVQQVDHTLRPARSPDSVTVLLEAPVQPYTVIAVIESRGESVFDSFEDLRDALRAKAASLGADAVILGPEHTDESFIMAGTALIRSVRRTLTGEVVVWRVDGQTDRRMGGWTDGRMDGWADGPMGRWNTEHRLGNDNAEVVVSCPPVPPCAFRPTDRRRRTRLPRQS